MISAEHTAWLEARGIDVEIASRHGLFTGRRHRHGEGKTAWTEVLADASGDVLAFPTTRDGKVVGEHYRLTRDKRFFQRKGSAQVFWNGDCLNDPALERGEPLIITEGQIDALTAITAGFPFAVSMPSGAQKPPDGRLADDLDPLDGSETDKPTGRFGSLYNARAQLKAVKRIVIATDADDPGQRLAAEIVRRLGPGRCARAEYPPGCKDINDVMVRHGRDAVVQCVVRAKPYPTQGLYRLSDFPELGEPQIYKAGWPLFDTHFRLAEGLFIPVVGVPMHGKSSFLCDLAIHIAQRNSVRFAIASFETPIKPTLAGRMLRMALPCAIRNATDDEVARAKAFLEDRFVFIEADERTGNVEDVTIDWMLDRMHDAIMRYSVKFFIVDPWNEIEHRRGPGETQSEYQNRAIRKMKAFCKTYGATLFVAVHPTKDIHEKGKIRRPNLYDCDGSAAWRNKADIGLVVHRPDMAKSTTEVVVDKVKYEFLGRLGTVNFSYNAMLGRYEEMDDNPMIGGLQ